MGAEFNYAEAFKTLDYAAVKQDLTALMTDSQPWWPADYGHYGPVLHPHGVAFGGHLSHRRRARRVVVGRAAVRAAQQLAGQRQPRQGAAPAVAGEAEIRRGAELGGPVHPRGQRRVESMGGPIFGFGGGRADVFEPEKDIYWGTEEEWLGQTRIDEESGHMLENPLAAIQHGLIYVNPEGPGGKP